MSDQERLQNAIDAFPDAFYALDAHWRVAAFNEAAVTYFGFPLTADQVIGKSIWELFPQGQGTPFAAALDRAMGGERVSFEAPSALKPGALVVLTMSRWGDGVGVVIRDVTAQTQAQRLLEESEERIRLAAEAAAIGTWDFNPETNELRWDDRCRALFGVSPGKAVSYEDTFLAGLHPEDRERAHRAVQAAIAPEGSPHYDIEYRTIGIEDGVERWIAAKGGALFKDGKAIRFIGTVLDISPRKRAERRFDLVNATGAQVAAERNVDTIVQSITDAGVELSGAEFGAFFYNKIDERGESYMLYTLSGAPREAFSKFPMPRNTEVFAPTFSGVGVVRSDDIRQDPRYGKNTPRHGMPEGHLPVCSYLAVPVISRSGEVLGGLFFGHKEKGVFQAEHETLLLGLAGQAATAIDNSRLIEQLQALNLTLEQRINQAVAERGRAEEQLRQSQKMEAIGQLTGGIAHDFNNMLAVVIGGLNLMQRRLKKGDADIDKYVEAALDGANRASALTKRLLAFSRQQPLEPAAVDANALILAMTELLRRTLGEHIQIKTSLADGLPLCFVDRIQLESAILNLAVNARDAMGEAGVLSIATANLVVDASEASRRDLPEGEFVEIAVTDNGHGMTPDVLAQAFDPFFTTKAVGKGSGLGLSQVFGFVQQSGGVVKLRSEVGKGTRAEIYLPRAKDRRETTTEASAHDMAASGGRETVLVVEDEERVRAYSAEALKELGYDVVVAANARHALDLLEGGETIDLLFTDIVMPDLNGRELARRALERRPALRVLFTTGYAREEGETSDVLFAHAVVLQKPFTVDQLAAKMRAVLDN